MIVDESAMERLGEIKVGEYRDVISRRLQGRRHLAGGQIVHHRADHLHLVSSWPGSLPLYVGPDNTVFIIVKVAVATRSAR